MDEFELFFALGLQPCDCPISSEAWEHVLIALNFSLFDFRFIINPFRNNRRKQNWSWSKKQLKGVTLNSFKRSSSFDYLQGYYHFSDVIIMTSLPLQNWQELENLQPFFSCWMLKNWIRYHMEKNGLWENWSYLFEISCAVFEYFNRIIPWTNGSLRISRESLNFSAISETLSKVICALTSRTCFTSLAYLDGPGNYGQRTDSGRSRLHPNCMCNVILIIEFLERFRICYLASESCDLHVISTITVCHGTVCYRMILYVKSVSILSNALV